MRFLVRAAITALGVLVVAYFGLIGIAGVGPGLPVTLHAYLTALVFAIVLGLVNAIIKPIVQVLSLPITIVTLGLFSLLVNLGMFYLAAAVTSVRLTDGFWMTALAAVVVAMFSGVAGRMTERAS
jgi:putative membrane protein